MNPRRKRILFVAEAVTLAHVTRPLVLAQALPSDQIEVHFASAERYEFVFRNTHFTSWPIQSISGERFLQALARGARLYDEQTLSAYIEEDLRLLQQVKPDLVVGDFRLSLAVSATLCKIPYAALANAHWSPYTTRGHFPLPEHPTARFLGVPLATALFHLVQPLVFAYHARPLNALRRKHGLPPLGNLLHIYTHGDFTLYTDLPSLVPTAGLPASHRYLGPIVWTPEVQIPPWWNDINPDKPVIYVTLGTSGQVDLLPMISEVLGQMPVTVMVATAGRLSLNNLADNIHTANYLPGNEAGRRAALVICNGGSATVYQALREGTPVLGIVSNMDQHLTMSSVSQAGAGTLLRAGRVTRGSLQQALTRLLYEQKYRMAARKLADEFRLWDAPSRFLSFVQETSG
jgi:UDP:flavonoid glycosyltransferase YjiC (YdhE family)